MLQESKAEFSEKKKKKKEAGLFMAAAAGLDITSCFLQYCFWENGQPRLWRKMASQCRSCSKNSLAIWQRTDSGSNRYRKSRKTLSLSLFPRPPNHPSPFLLGEVWALSFHSLSKLLAHQTSAFKYQEVSGSSP